MSELTLERLRRDGQAFTEEISREGYLAHSFGPLSADGGERRLNVLISRAKLRCEVFANFTGAQYLRINRVRELLVAGRLDDELRWRLPVGAG